MSEAQPKKKLISFAGGDEDDDYGDESIAQAIERVLGSEALNKVRAHVGGTKVSIPPAGRLHPDHWLAQTLGFEAAFRFCDEVLSAEIGAHDVYIPLGPISSQRKIRQRIEVLLHEGWSANDIARNLKCHERTVWRVKRHWYASRNLPHPNRSRNASASASRKKSVRRSEKARTIVRQLLLEGHSAALLRDVLAVPGSIILSIKTELIREGKL